MTLLMLDLSNNNPTPDFKSLKLHGVWGIEFKVTEGYDFVDPDFQTWRKQAQDAGIRCGYYHFARPDSSSGTEQGLFFSEHVGKVGRTDLRPALDYEVVRKGGGDEDWIRNFNSVVKQKLGVGPLFYSNPNVITLTHISKPVGYGLWLADYTSVKPPAPHPWKSYVAWQHTKNGRVGTYFPVDESIVYSQNAMLAHPILGRV